MMRLRKLLAATFLTALAVVLHAHRPSTPVAATAGMQCIQRIDGTVCCCCPSGPCACGDDIFQLSCSSIGD